MLAPEAAPATPPAPPAPPPPPPQPGVYIQPIPTERPTPEPLPPPPAQKLPPLVPLWMVVAGVWGLIALLVVLLLSR